ncbi:MAG TPA: YeiH family protein [Verrucomicrobiae bacterium]|nr:YeiH family protein [Verrucomicrobiae bacterium]
MQQSDYSWAEYLDYMEGADVDVISLPAGKPAAQGTPKAQPLWGALLAAGVTILAFWLSVQPFPPFTLSGNRHPIEPVMLAILLGMAAGNSFGLSRSLQPGIKFCVKKLLPLGIVLLGARLNFREMVKVGGEGLALSVVETVVALGLLYLLTIVLRLPRKLGVLLGIGTAICGGTAIVATAPVIEAEDKDVAFSVATVTLLGLIAMLALPFLGHVLKLSSTAFGIWAGLAIHQTPQVVAAGFAYSPEAGQTATIVKLARVCLLAPVVFLIGFAYAWQKARRTGVSERKNINYARLFPMFIIGFLGLALLNTSGLLPNLTLHFAQGGALQAGDRQVNLSGSLQQISMFLITLSMAAVGLETKFVAMRQTGLKPFIASFAAALAIACLTLVMIQLFGAGL